MKNGQYHGLQKVILYLLAMACASTSNVYAAGTTLKNIREGLHTGYSRLVLECEGALPESVGPAHLNTFSVRFADLAVNADLKKISGRLRGNVRQIDLKKGKAASSITMRFAAPGSRVKSFVMKSKTASQPSYRLVIDVYPQPRESAAKKSKTPTVPTPAAPLKAAQAASPAAVAPAAPPAPVISPTPSPRVEAPPETAVEKSTGEAAAPAVAAAQDSTAPPKTSDWTYSVAAGLVARSADNENESSKFEEYHDISQPVAGDVALKAEKDGRLYLNGSAAGIGQDDPRAAAGAGYYGKYDVDLTYERMIQRYAFDAKTLYSGVGSDNMTLDDTLQTNVQNAATPAARATVLNNALSGAATGDPDTTRDRLKLGLNVVALDPFTLKIQIGHEKRQGTRPFTGGFGLVQVVEIFEPIDYETNDFKISAEYADNGRLLNIAYHYSQFTNNIDTLTFDNPLRVTDDAIGGPSSGRFDLAPDNRMHDFALTGALTRLPGNSQISANLAWGMMLQDDKLVPFTSNTAISAPGLPVDRVNAQVNTTLANLRLTSRPLPYLHLKGHLRYFDYDNRTKQIDFSNGYVESDESLIATAVTNLPASYTKTRTGLDVGFDVLKRTSLGLGYTIEHTDRENREVKKQDDSIIKASLDSRALQWLNLRTSYERTDRQIGDYDNTVYLAGGINLNELPQMRKYDQADMVRDRYQVQATLYPIQTLALTGTFTYGKDDYQESPYGLLEDKHYIMSLDADYAISDRASLNLFYSYEKYDNKQRGNSGGTDWTADGEDKVTTLGGGMTLALIPERLDLNLSYSYSEADGNIAFASPAGSFADYKDADDTKLHILNSKLSYHFSKYLILSLGYLWEKFEYEDYNKNGFAYVPTNPGGDYLGALLAGTLPEDYNAHVIYTQLKFQYVKSNR